MIKTANLTANTETSISGLGGAHCRINNNTAGMLYASANGGIVPGGDDVTAIPAGRGDYVVGTQGTVYLLSASGGSVQVEGTDVLNRPFDNAAVTGGVAVGNPVVMDGLQGGVPFSEMVVSGKNMIPYPYHTPNIHTTNGITFTVNDDKSITANGTATAQADYYIKTNLPIRKGRYTLSGCPEGGMIDNKVYYTIQAFGDTLYVSGNGILDTGNGAEIDATEDFVIKRIMIRIAKDTVCDNVIFRPQLETGDTATAYEPPITGRELTINACGKNLIPYPYIRQEVQTKEVTMVDNGDGTVTLSGTATANIIFWLGRFTIKAGKYTVSGFNSKYKDGRAYVGVRNGQGGVISNFFETSNSRGTVTISEDTEIQPIIYVNSGATFNGDIAAPQLELGDTVTAYEPYRGAEYTITPDSNPYTVPDDIRQQDGLNVVTASAGTLEVVGVRKNAAIKKIWDKLDELTTAAIVSTADLSE